MDTSTTKPPWASRQTSSKSKEYAAPAAPDKAFELGWATLERELQEFLREVHQRLGWLYPIDFGHIPMDAFRLMARLAILEKCAAHMSAVERAQRAQVAPKVAADLEATPAYQEVRQAIDDSWAFTATPRPLREHIADPLLQHKIAQRTARMALHAGDTRVAVKATEQINDRAMPAVSKGGDTHVLVIAPEHADRIEQVLQFIASKQLQAIEPASVKSLPSDADG